MNDCYFNVTCMQIYLANFLGVNRIELEMNNGYALYMFINKCKIIMVSKKCNEAMKNY